MHASSMKFMKDFLDSYAVPKFPEGFTVLDVGSQAVHGHDTYRKLLPANATYTGLDVAAGVNVDVVVENPYDWKELDGTEFDVIISGQCLEHIEFPWVTMEEIKKRLKPGGLLCVIVPSAGPEHRYPVDTFRYYPDGLLALCKWAKLTPVNATYNQDSQWHDCRLIATT